MLKQELGRVAPDRESIITIGVFDGVHRGHQYLINTLVNQAHTANLLAGVVTFSTHPAATLRPDFKINYLTTLEERVRLIKELESATTRRTTARTSSRSTSTATATPAT